MDFIRNGQTLFRAPIDGNNCAHLSGSIEPLPESANWVSTLPLTPSLWHRRCCHHNFADIAKMHKDDLVTGMTFALSEKPDTVCEPCLAGKMCSNPFLHLPHVLPNRLNSFTPISMVLSQFLLGMDIAIGSHSLMTPPRTVVQ